MNFPVFRGKVNQMKCVENTHTGKLLRVSDEEAHELTSANVGWKYVPKSKWKAQNHARND